MLASVAAIDWLVRSRRLSPFGRVARFFRSYVDPLLAPIERRVVRAGGLPTSAPWWALAFVVLGGILLLEGLGYARGMTAELLSAGMSGPSSITRVLLRWTFLLLEVALMVRVIASWLAISRYSRWVRWSFALTEWMLRPIRRVVPTVSMVDFSPLIAWFLLSWVLQPFVLALVSVTP